MIRYLKEHFQESGEPSERTSLAIAGGESGARLTHSHAKQYAFVLQSLTLWREIANDMFRLWYLAEDDLVRASNPYAQRDTGQGLQRVQHAPRTTRAMHQLLHTTQAKCGSWVGSSLIHLGDSNVPNAHMFIDKYSQVRKAHASPTCSPTCSPACKCSPRRPVPPRMQVLPRMLLRIFHPILSAACECPPRRPTPPQVEHILHPILSTLSSLEQLIQDDEALNAWMQATYGGLTELQVAILQDFFRFGFDGSGADNFFDAGSCIDGRLTSAWNWCSSLPHKPFYIAFQLTGNTSFDGQFQE
jgi:hypothetical protein